MTAMKECRKILELVKKKRGARLYEYSLWADNSGRLFLLEIRSRVKSAGKRNILKGLPKNDPRFEGHCQDGCSGGDKTK